MKYLLVIMLIFILPCYLFSQNKNRIVDEKNSIMGNEQTSYSYNSNLKTINFSNKKLLIEVKQVDSSMIIKETPVELLKKNNKLMVKQADSSMIIKETPVELLKKNNKLMVKQADSSMIIKETPTELLKQK